VHALGVNSLQADNLVFFSLFSLSGLFGLFGFSGLFGLFLFGFNYPI